MDRSANTIIIYGSYGYTGSLIVNECRLQGMEEVILAGRDPEKLEKQSKESRYPFVVVDISETEPLRRLLGKGKVVIHCAGPFQFTAKAMVEACLKTGTHYVDITGEHQVFEMLAGYDKQAKQSNITVLPGAGFDVVPSDCLALHLKDRLPSATHLQLAFTMSKGGMSRGTARTSIEGLGHGSLIRRNNVLVNIPLGRSRQVDFGSFKTNTLNIPWGDISTAWQSTGIPDIEVYAGVNDNTIRLARLSKYINPLLRLRIVKDFLKAKVDKKVSGPDEERRKAGKSFLWGRVWDDAGHECISVLETLNGYALTAKTSVLIAEKIVKGNIKTGYQTPAMAYGKDLILEIGQTSRKDI